MDIWQILRRHEGLRSEPYCDRCGTTIIPVADHWSCACTTKGENVGAMTIGVGHNLSVNPLSDEDIWHMLHDDVVRIGGELISLPWYYALGTGRQWAILDMAFTMGVAGVKQFTAMIGYLEGKQWELAADAILSSKWATEAPGRAAEDAAAIRTGAWSES